MGYNLTIGEAVFVGDKSNLYMKVGARGEIHGHAPTFDNDPLTGNSNMRSPGYSVWTNFCRDTGLYPVFYGMNGTRNPYMEPDDDCYREVPLLAEHPGFQLIGPQDVVAFKDALDRHIAKHGHLTPGFRPWGESDDEAPETADACATRARLIWLHYWADWAVANCEWPVIANT
jgi:hypothetical protein